MKEIFTPTEENFPKKADVVVVGGGIVGTATAFWLSRAGLDTVLFEMRDGLSTLTTPNSVECFRAQFAEPAMSSLAQGGLTVFENFLEVIGIPDYAIGLSQKGYLFITDDSAMIDSLKAAVEKHHTLGVTDSEFLSKKEIQQRFSFVSENAVAATFRQKDGWLSSHEVTQGFAKGSNARFFVQTKLIDILKDSKGVSGVETTHGTVSTRVVINAAGPFAGVVG